MAETTPTTAASKPPVAQPQPDHRKKCTLCDTPRNVLVRCQIDESGTWHFLCVGSCWKRVSGGKEDGDAEHPLYRYGGMWKNKHEAISAKKKVQAKKPGGTDAPAERRSDVPSGLEASEAASGTDVAEADRSETPVNGHSEITETARNDDGLETWSGDRIHYTTNDRILYSGRTWICRKTHYSQPHKPPHTAQNLWKAKARLVEE